MKHRRPIIALVAAAVVGTIALAALRLGRSPGADGTQGEATSSRLQPGAPAATRSSTSPSEAANRLALRAQDAQKAGDIDRAIALYRESLAASPDFTAAWNNLGLLLLEKKEYTDAVDAFERAAELRPSDPRPLHNIGVAFGQAGLDQKALDAFLRALERDRRDLTALRGAVGCGRKLRLADDASLERVRAAMAIDTDAAWRPLYEREESRIETVLRGR